MALNCTRYLHCDPVQNEVYSKDGDLEFVRCKSCGIIWRSPGSANISRDYGKEYFELKNYEKNRAHKIIKSGWLIDIARSRNPGITTLLEVGCSVGNTLEAAKHRNIRPLGIDISEYAVDFCLSCGLEAENKTLEQLRDENRHFDLIFMQHVLEHFQNPFQVISLCRDLLNPKGVLLIMVPNARYRNAVLKRGKHRFYSLSGVGSEHYAYFDYSSILKLVESQGLKVVQMNYPLQVKGNDSVEFFLNRFFRKSLSLFHADQELLVLAEKARN